MSQSKLESWVETVCNIGSGFVVSLLMWMWVVQPLYNSGDMTSPFVITCVFTVSSVIRSYLWRRFFNAELHRVIHVGISKISDIWK